MKEAVVKDVFKASIIGAKQAVLTHLQFADDILFFGEWSSNTAASQIAEMF